MKRLPLLIMPAALFLLPACGPAPEDTARTANPDCSAPPDMSKGYVWKVYSSFDLYVANADGSNKRRVTDNEYANFAPFFLPDNERIIFSSNLGSEKSGMPDFNLWMIREDGTGLEQITRFQGFDGFPMFTQDGRTRVFASNRHNRNPKDTNVFLADWVD